ncbi:MAG: hypothetical protein ACYTG2_18330 [Planctomycetota bacterium]|jgi:hypothetical protein
MATRALLRPVRTPRAPAPSAVRLAVVLGATAAWALGCGLIARALAPDSATLGGAALSVVVGVAGMGVVGSITEWLVHRLIMHRRLPLLRLAYDMHHRAHHWVHFPPDDYLHAEVEFVPLVPPRPEEVCPTAAGRLVSALGQAAFYTLFALPLVAGAWWASGNAAFAVAVGLTSAVIIVLAVHVHSSVHCPGHSPLERFGWFWFLDHHHYVHHIDTEANTNFLLPLGDLLLGTLRLELDDEERRRWPSYAEARARVSHGRQVAQDPSVGPSTGV